MEEFELIGLEDCVQKVNGLALEVTKKESVRFEIGASVNQLKTLLKSPPVNQTYKLISVQGGFSSISFIKYISEIEDIIELYATTLRIGKKQMQIIDSIGIPQATFIVSSMMKNDVGKLGEYFNFFVNTCKKNKWKWKCVNNHAKLILMRTKLNYYVLETSSNLNENPRIEQYSFENDKGLYMWYSNIIKEIGGD